MFRYSGLRHTNIYKTVMSLLLAFVMVTASALNPLSVHAAEDESSREQITETAGDETVSIPENPAVIEGVGPAASAGELTLEAAAGIVMDMDSGEVLYGKNILDKHYPASITKIMTAYLATKYGKPDDLVTFSHDAVYSIEFGSANAGMQEGEVITLDECLRCMMAQSANDCAYAAGETVGSDMAAFVSMMNEAAAELGCVNSHFVNPHGLHDEDHYVCALDMALIAAAAYNDPWFRDICHIEQYHRPITEMNPEDAWPMTNRHKMFHPESEYYWDCVTGGKTGYTDEARTTLVTYAEKDGRRLVAVVLQDAGVQAYSDTKALLEYGFDNFENVSIAELADRDKILKAPENVVITVPLEKFAGAPREEIVFEHWNRSLLRYEVNGYELAAANVILTYDYYRSIHDDLETEEASDNFFKEYPGFVIVAAVFLIAVIVFVITAVKLGRIRKQRRNKTAADRDKEPADNNKAAADNNNTVKENEHELGSTDQGSGNT